MPQERSRDKETNWTQEAAWNMPRTVAVEIPHTSGSPTVHLGTSPSDQPGETFEPMTEPRPSQGSPQEDATDPAPRDEPEPPFPEQDQELPGVEEEMEPQPRFEAPAYSPANKLEGRRALVTGGDSGIGRAVAVLFAREGADVAFTHLPEERQDAKRTLQEIHEEGAQGVAIETNLSHEGSAQNVVDRTVRELGGLDLLVNNAAFQEHVDSFEELSWEHWKHTFDVNIHGYFRVAQAAIQHMEPGSSIINTGSITGMQGRGSAIDYATTKGAIHTFTKSLAQDLIDEGIRVNCVSPGPVWTPLNPAERDDEEIEDFGERTGLDRPAEPEEVAPAYVFLASNADSSAITGEVLTILAGDTRAG